MKVLCLPQQMF